MCYCSARLRGSNAVTYASRVIVHATPEPNATGLTSLYVVASTLITVVRAARHANSNPSDVRSNYATSSSDATTLNRRSPAVTVIIAGNYSRALRIGG